jgi:hypothetical protein
LIIFIVVVLPAAGRPEQHADLARVDLHGDGVDRDGLSEDLADAVEADHGRSPGWPAITDLLMLRCEERSDEPRSTHRRWGAAPAGCVLRGPLRGHLRMRGLGGGPG